MDDTRDLDQGLGSASRGLDALRYHLRASTIAAVPLAATVFGTQMLDAPAVCKLASARIWRLRRSVWS